MVMAVNNAPLLGSVVDTSGFVKSYEDGRKLREKYDARQHQKALNDILRFDTKQEQLDAARQHKYAGALVPIVQRYQAEIDKANIDVSKTSADIKKTLSEAGKYDADAYKTYGEADGIQIKNAEAVRNNFAALAAGRDINVFAFGVGEMRKRGIITPEQTQSVMRRLLVDPEGAVGFLERMAMTNPDVADIFKPEYKETDAGDKKYGYSVNSFTGEAGEPSMTITKGTSPDVVHQGGVSERNNQRTVGASMYASDNTLTGTKYTADTNAETKLFEINQEGQIEWAKFDEKVKQDNKTTNAGGATGKGLESDERKKLIEIEENNNSTKQAIASLKKMQALAGDDETYSGFAASQRAAVASNLGIGGKQADNTVLYDSLATGQALEQLRSVFGGNPTEGERKILLEIQASSNKTPAQKKAILNNAIKMAEARIANNNRTADRIRTGEYASTTDTGATQSRAGYRTNKNHGRKGTSNKPKVSPTVQKYADEHFGGR